MDAQTLTLCVLIAMGFVGWPILGNYTKASAGWVSVIVSVGTTIIVSLLYSKQLGNGTVPSSKAIGLLILAAVVNGAAVYLYANKITDPALPTAILVVTVSILMAVCAPLMSWGLNGAAPTLRQGAGFFLAAAAIYLLSK